MSNKDNKQFSLIHGKNVPMRIVVMILACSLLGLGISFYVHAAMGSDPFSTLNLGISSKLPISFGVWQAIVNIVLLVVVVIFDKSMLGLGTIGNMFLCGFTADFFNIFLDKMLPPTEEMSIALRIVLTLVGVAVQLIGVSFYVTADLGMAPYDCISYIVPDRTKIPFRWWRILLDCTCIGVGFAFGASFGIGSILMAFCTGPILPLLNKYMAGPLLKAENVR